MSVDVVVSDEGIRVLVALRDAMATSGALAPHLYAIGNAVGLDVPYLKVRDRLIGLQHAGLVERNGEGLEFSLTRAGEQALEAAGR